MDTEANAFAAYLLMPDPWFSKAVDGLDFLDDVAVAAVARKFKVPIGAVVYRATLP